MTMNPITPEENSRLVRDMNNFQSALSSLPPDSPLGSAWNTGKWVDAHGVEHDVDEDIRAYYDRAPSVQSSSALSDIRGT